MSPVWEESFRVRAFEAEPGGSAGVPAICRYMQETANGHVGSIGMSVRDVMANGRMWVLVRFALRLMEPPRVGDAVRVETWAPGWLTPARAYRDFRIHDGRGRVLAEASSLWMLLDSTTRRPLRMPETIMRLRREECVTSQRVDSVTLTEPGRAEFETRRRVFRDDLDENAHANNVRFVEWVLDSVPAPVRLAARLSALDIRFVEEIALGDKVVSIAEADGDGAFRHSLRANERLAAVARTEWAAAGA
jgi:medium-chain acyl-[acyl-carrier-protein] hydrolase